jgi:hypothetical protein
MQNADPSTRVTGPPSPEREALALVVHGCGIGETLARLDTNLSHRVTYR